jgi:hypothetical protein
MSLSAQYYEMLKTMFLLLVTLVRFTFETCLLSVAYLFLSAVQLSGPEVLLLRTPADYAAPIRVPQL